MDLFLGPGTSQGEPYIPDEMAKAIVDDMKLRKGDAVSKRAICAFLEKKGLSSLLATDVAMVLRNMYGLTPTFDEGKKMDLIGELNRVLVEDYNNPVKAKPKKAAPPKMEDLVKVCNEALQEVFNAAKDPVEEMVVAKLATMSLSQIEEIASLGQHLSESDLDQIDECLERGGRPLAEAWFDVAARPHLHRFMESKTQHELSEVGADPGYFSSMAHLKRKSQQAPANGGPTDSRGKQLDRTMLATRSRRQVNRAQGGEDELAKREPGHMAKLAGGGTDHIGDLHKSLNDPSMHGAVTDRLARREKEKKAAIQNATSKVVDRQKEAPANLPNDVAPKGPGLGARLKSAGHAALGAVGDMAKRVKAGISGGGEAPATGQPAVATAGAEGGGGEKKPGFFKKLVHGAGHLMKHVASHLGAAALHHVRSSMPAIGYAFGAPGEKEQKYADLLHQHGMRKAELRTANAGARAAAGGGGGRRQLPNRGMNRPRGTGRPGR